MKSVYRVDSTHAYKSLMQHLESQGYLWASGNTPTSLSMIVHKTIYIFLEEFETVGWNNPLPKIRKSITWSDCVQSPYTVWIGSTKLPSIFRRPK